MRLLNTETFCLETFHGLDVPKYAALSHTWGEDEVTFEDLRSDVDRTKQGWGKILGSANEAKKFGCDYIWIDTCCIDKSSSAELSEAINSMFQWYRKSKICLAYLEDVFQKAQPRSMDIEPDSKVIKQPCLPQSAMNMLSGSRWFTRGWTLQELIAPANMVIYDRAWNRIGSKEELGDKIADVTGIDLDVLRDYQSLYSKSIARRMSWAAKRKTTRVEDIAYCLMGIFNVNMPLLYGEGEKAFVRLQEEIMRSQYDHSLFAWNRSLSRHLWGVGQTPEGQEKALGVGVLAPHPEAFDDSASIVAHAAKLDPYFITNRGIQIQLRLYLDGFELFRHAYFAVLQCSHEQNLGTFIGVPLVRSSATQVPGSKPEFCRAIAYDLIELRHTQVATLELQTVYLLSSGIFSLSQMTGPLYHCRFRRSGHTGGFKIHEAKLREHAGETSEGDFGARRWDRDDKSLNWTQAWQGVRTAWLFYREDGPFFLVSVTFMQLSNGRTYIVTELEIIPLNWARSIREIESRRSLVELLFKDAPTTVSTEEVHVTHTEPVRFGQKFISAHIMRDTQCEEYFFVLEIYVSRERSKHPGQ